uniref:Uncharacterized protein n=1 Tax=Myotis myotis TaxID=51298 RepID=A0A7J8AMU6_MYOMY|nr:hypothetical protein mMyoMyo1_008207 [Myotis myotis]
MNGHGEPAPDGRVGLIHQHAGSSAPAPDEGLSGVPRASKSRSSSGRIGGCGPAFRKGPCFSHDRPAPQLSRSPLFLLALWKAAPHPLHPPVAPERTQASLCEPGSQGGHWASPGGPALEMGNWLQNSPSPPPTGPEHSPPFSAPLPHCLIVTEALHQPAVPLPCSSGQGTGDSVHPCSDPSLPPLQPAPLARSGLSSVGAALRPRRAGCQPGQGAALQPSGQVPACLSLLDASSNRELPLSRSSPLRARTRRGFAEPSPAFCICLRGSRSPPHPLCPPLSAGSQLPLGPLLPVRWSKPPIKGQLWGPRPGPNDSRLHLSRLSPRLCPCSLGAGTGPFALLFCREPRGGRGSPLPCPAALDLPVERLQSPLSFLWPLC